MKLRELRQSDAKRMLEWMHDTSVVEKLQTDFRKKTLEDCRKFIANSNDDENVNLAVTDDNDNYMGTVSLKHIHDGEAEFAIALHKDAIGKGMGILAMRKMLDMGFVKYGLSKIYWCVAKDNVRALRFYDKNLFKRIKYEDVKMPIGYTREQVESYIWYQVKGEHV